MLTPGLSDLRLLSHSSAKQVWPPAPNRAPASFHLRDGGSSESTMTQIQGPQPSAHCIWANVVSPLPRCVGLRLPRPASMICSWSPSTPFVPQKAPSAPFQWAAPSPKGELRSASSQVRIPRGRRKGKRASAVILRCFGQISNLPPLPLSFYLCSLKIGNWTESVILKHYSNKSWVSFLWINPLPCLWWCISTALSRHTALMIKKRFSWWGFRQSGEARGDDSGTGGIHLAAPLSVDATKELRLRAWEIQAKKGQWQQKER